MRFLRPRVLSYSEAEVLTALDGAMPTCCPAAALAAVRAAAARGLPPAQLQVCCGISSVTQPRRCSLVLPAAATCTAPTAVRGVPLERGEGAADVVLGRKRSRWREGKEMQKRDM